MTRSRLLGARPGSRRLVRPRGVAAAGRRRRGAGRHVLHGHRLRLRPRPRPLAVRRPGRGQPGPLVEADHRLLLPRDSPRPGPRHHQGAHHRGQEGRRGRRPRRAPAHAADRAQGLHPGQGAAEGDALADHAARLEERGVLPRSRPRRLAEVDDVPGCRRVLGRQPAGHAPAAEARVRGVPRRAALGREAHGQRAADRPLRAGRRPARGPGGVAGPGGPRPGRGGAHVRRVRAGDRDVVLRHLRHRVLPGLRRSRGRAPGVQRRGEGDRRQGRALPGPAGLHPVLLEQRRLQLGRLAALPGRPARSLRSVLGQPQRPVDRHGHAAPRSRRPGPRSAPSTNLSFSRDGLGAHFGGRVTSVTLTGSLGGLPTSVKVTGDDFRFRLGLKSTWFELAPAWASD